MNPTTAPSPSIPTPANSAMSWGAKEALSCTQISRGTWRETYYLRQPLQAKGHKKRINCARYCARWGRNLRFLAEGADDSKGFAFVFNADFSSTPTRFRHFSMGYKPTKSVGNQLGFTKAI